jgi:uncharacterized membrane protein YbhN (UPF0104 family)
MLKIYMLKTLLKITFAAALVVWLLGSGKLDLSLVKKTFEVGPQWLIALTLIFIQACLPFLTLYRLNFIGLFFSSVLPGAVTGDLIKMVYIKKLDKNFSKSFLLTITLLDRVLGLTGLLFLSGIFSLYYFKEVTQLSPQIGHIISLNLLLFLGAILFLATLIAPSGVQNFFDRIVALIPLLGRKVAILLQQLFALRESKKILFKTFAISIVMQFISIVSFWIISSPFLASKVPLQYAFTFIPVGLIATAIPISPGGLGVGHVLFANLFSLVHVLNGASLFNLFYLCNLAHNFLGVIPYLLIQKTNKDINMDLN